MFDDDPSVLYFSVHMYVPNYCCDALAHTLLRLERVLESYHPLFLREREKKKTEKTKTTNGERGESDVACIAS